MNEPEIMTIKLDCKALDPDKLIVVSIDQSMKREIPKIQQILRDSFPTIKFMIVDKTIKVEEFEHYLERIEQYKIYTTHNLFLQSLNIEHSKVLRKDLEEKLRKYDKENTAYTIDQAKNMLDDQIELAKKKATKAYDDALRRQK